jgi:4-hydroxythreonine-4-phosphate dehydrogenase
MRPLALTMGDPAGIGGELSGKAWCALRKTGPVFFLLDDPSRFGDLPVRTIGAPSEAATCFAEALPVLPIKLRTPAVPGRPDPANAPSVIAAIEQAVSLARAGQASAVVTNPISKAVLYRAGFPHPGHTEFLGALTGATQPVMMLASPLLRVVPVTVHVALRRALEMLDTDAIVAAGRITADALRRDFGLAAPRLGVAALNPHAGENGAMGDEEARIILPAIATLRAQGVIVSGPYPPDTMFTEEARQSYDAAICMYHDQALIPLKTLDRDRGVNVTLGLPIVRTSPDHGTAFDIAGSGRADPSSLVAALRLAGEIAARRNA